MDKNFSVCKVLSHWLCLKREGKKEKRKGKKDEHNSLVVDRSCTTHCSRVDIYPYTICLKFKLYIYIYIYISIHEGFDWINMSVSPSKVLEISVGTQC